MSEYSDIMPNVQNQNSTADWTREQHFDSLTRLPDRRLVIIGGGVHGAALARLAGLNGTDCLLLERGDYASGTSSRSSKMAHGGLRYLENFDFEQVFEGIKSREELFEDANHIVRPGRFLIPINANDHWMKLKLGVGLRLYDLMAKSAVRKHRWVSRAKLNYEGFSSNREDLLGCYLYTDGLMNDSRLVIESIVHARQMGSMCLNYAEVKQVQKEVGGKTQIVFEDRLTGRDYEVRAEVVMNCAGPWVPFIGNSAGGNLTERLRYSAGTHLLFNRAWTAPSLFLPMPGKNRYYFVWPHPGGTMVGTTEREVTELPEEQMPTKSEIDEVLERLKRDLPKSGLDRSSLYYAFSGVRTLPLRDRKRSTAQLSRKHVWQEADGMLTLLGGKFTSANWTAFEGFKIACEKLAVGGKLESLSGVPYPGAGSEENLNRIENELLKSGLKDQFARRLIRRLGMRCDYLLEDASRLSKLTHQLTVGEVELGVNFEQAETIEDILRRRTEIEYLPGCGLEEVHRLSEYLARLKPGADMIAQERNYVERIAAVQKALSA